MGIFFFSILTSKGLKTVDENEDPFFPKVSHRFPPILFNFFLWADDSSLDKLENVVISFFYLTREGSKNGH